MADLPRPSAVLFDLDGTLVDTVPTRVDAWMAALSEFDVSADRDHIARLIGIDGKRLAREAGEAAGIPMRVARAGEIDERHGEIYEELNRNPAALPGVREIVDALEDAKIQWAIATSSGNEGQTRPSVKALDLASEPTIVDGSHVDQGKPAPDLFLEAAKQLDVEDRDRCWCVGDATWDMKAARAAGMVPVAVTAGAAVTADDLRGAGAVVVVDTLADLVPLIT